jgi:hypothetical protein
MQSTKTARDLIAGIRTNLQIIRGDLRDLRTDLAYDWRYLRANLHYDRLDLADNLRAGLMTWRQQRAARHQASPGQPPHCPYASCHHNAPGSLPPGHPEATR